MSHLPQCSRRPIVGPVGLLVGIIVVGVVSVLIVGQAGAAAAEPSASVQAGAENSRKGEPKGGFGELTGRWRRPDGGYVIEIKKVDSDGTMEAAYFNPKPIRVAKAQAAREGQVLKAFIELNDVGYPGSTYTLTYDPQTDRLTGVYFQAAIRQSFDVVFMRMK
jgi:hypothetical protein